MLAAVVVSFKIDQEKSSHFSTQSHTTRLRQRKKIWILNSMQCNWNAKEKKTKNGDNVDVNEEKGFDYREKERESRKMWVCWLMRLVTFHFNTLCFILLYLFKQGWSKTLLKQYFYVLVKLMTFVIRS